VPQVSAERGVLLDGKLPNWLYAALARTYRAAAWVAVLQPQHGYIVIWSQQTAVPVGTVLPTTQMNH
jgi:CRISPR-associated Csx3 family protein